LGLFLDLGVGFKIKILNVYNVIGFQGVAGSFLEVEKATQAISLRTVGLQKLKSL